MKRIGIFQLFNEHGFIEEYVEFLLKSMHPILLKLVIVCNCNIEKNELEKLQQFSDDIYIREDIGFDAGAYKDVLLNLHQENWDEWDEIVIFNDTFYGPFYSWDKIFHRMRDENVDFWGLSRHLGKVRVAKDRDFVPEHLQAYFIVIRKRMFVSSSFWQFWEELEYPKNYFEAVENFECRFTAWFRERGFSYTSWIDIKGENPYITQGIDPCTEHIYELLKEFEFPVIKYKTMSIGNFEQMKKALEFVQNYTDYDVNIIVNRIRSQSIEGKWRPFSANTLDEFVKNHDRIFIFGSGKYGQGVEQYLHYKNWHVDAHVVSAPQNDNDIAFDDFEMNRRDGLIVALGRMALEEMKDKISQKFGENQVLFPYLG